MSCFVVKEGNKNVRNTVLLHCNDIVKESRPFCFVFCFPSLLDFFPLRSCSVTTITFRFIDKNLISSIEILDHVLGSFGLANVLKPHNG